MSKTPAEYEKIIRIQNRVINRMVSHLEDIADFERRNPMSAPNCVVGTKKLLDEVSNES